MMLAWRVVREKYMAHTYTNLPKHRGENDLAKQLVGMADPKCHLWFSLDYIPGVRDIDVLIWHEEAGVFCLEVKAVPLSLIEEFGLKRCIITGRDTNDGPQNQAYRAMESLQRYVRPMGIDPYFISTACWPVISRSEWRRTWDNPAIAEELSWSMIFEEDLTMGVEVFVERLQYIRKNPPVRGGAWFDFRHSPRDLIAMQNALEGNTKKKAAVSDLQKLRVIEEKVMQETIREVPSVGTTRLLYTGYPGTGKTFRLLQIATHHTFQGRKVLYCCFNKTLAADIRRILSYSEKLPMAAYALEVYDVFDMLRYYNHGNDFESELRSKLNRAQNSKNDEYDMWAELLVEDMKRRELSLGKYDTVLIDEAQDMKNWAFEMIEMHMKPETSICVAAGSGQELYGASSQWLTDYEPSKSHSLRRNFRNTKPVFMLAKIAYEAKMNAGKIATEVIRFTGKSSVKAEIPLFEREAGSLPKIINLDETTPSDYPERLPMDWYHNRILSEYKRIITQQTQNLAEGGTLIDILLLVPDAHGAERLWATEALKELGVEYIDYTQEKNRRNIAPPGKVRLCTFHSSRGLEAQHVIIFGIEHLENVATKTSTEMANIAYIILSRANFDCVIVVRRSVPTAIVAFIESTLRALHVLPER